MNEFRFIRKNWDNEAMRDYLAGAIYNAVLYANGKEENGDYIVRFRVGGGGVYIAYWETAEPSGMLVAHVRVGSPALKTVSWLLDYTQLDTSANARLYWCPREDGMPNKAVSHRVYTREWCLYEGVYKWARQRGWNPEGEDGKPLYRFSLPLNRERIVSEMLEASKMGRQEERNGIF